MTDFLDLDLRYFDADFEGAVEEGLRRARISDEVRRRRDHELAEPLAARWSGVRGDLVRRAETAPPSVLEYAPGEFLFYRNGYQVLFGPPDSAKTWLLHLAAADELKRGHAVVLIDYEMGASAIVERLAHLAVERSSLHRLLVIEPDAHLLQNGREYLVEAVKDLGAPLGLIGIDSQDESFAIAGFDPMASASVALWVADLPRWCVHQWPQAAVIGIDHTPLSTTNRPAGSQRKIAAADAMFAVRSQVRISRDKAGFSDVSAVKDRMGFHSYDAPLARLFGGGARPFEIRPLSDAEKTAVSDGALRDKILAFLDSYGFGKWITVDALKKAIGGNSKHVGEILAELAESGLIEKVTGHGVRLISDV